MNDTRITNAFNNLASEIKPRPADWSRVERRIRRGYRLRFASGVVASVAAVLVVATVAPRVGDALRDDRLAEPGQSGAPVTSTRVAFRDDFAGYYFSFPSDLLYRGFMDGVPGVDLNSRDDELSIEIFSQPPVTDIVATTKGMVAQSMDPIHGGHVERFTEPGSSRDLYRITWDKGANGVQKLVILQFMATTTSDDVRATYGNLVQDIISSAAPVSAFRPERWVDTAVYTPWGRVDAGVRFDERTRLVAQFLAARADDETVTDTRSGTSHDIERYGVSPSIFFEATSLQSVPGYVIARANETASGDTEFTVRIADGRDEAITVGADGSGDVKIREVRILRN